MVNRRYSKEIKGKNLIENPYVFAKLFRGNPYIKEVTLHKETIYIEDKAFKDCKSLERINIPSKVEYLTSQMFYGCISLREIIAESPVPPKCYPDRFCCLRDANDDDNCSGKLYCIRLENLFTEKPKCFEEVNKQTCIIRVPKGSVELYKQAKEWKEFENIIEL